MQYQSWVNLNNQTESAQITFIAGLVSSEQKEFSNRIYAHPRYQYLIRFQIQLTRQMKQIFL